MNKIPPFTGDVYKHRSSLDIHYIVHRSEEIKDPVLLRITGYRLYVTYFNHFYKFTQGESEWITIKAEDLPNWSEVSSSIAHSQHSE